MDTGTRWSGKANPRDLTKTRQQALLRQKAEREAAANLDPVEEYHRGFQAGKDEGWENLLMAIVGMYQRDGLKAIEELLDELTPDDDEHQDQEA